jgi:hypothetical protein
MWHALMHFKLSWSLIFSCIDTYIHIVLVQIAIIVNRSQSSSISGHVHNMITSLVASTFLTRWHTQVHKPEVQDPLNLKVEGPWGGLGGVSFNDGLATGIKGFKIKSNAKVLFSLSVEYDKRGKSFHSHHHGNPSSDRAKKLQEDEVSLIYASCDLGK